jgi:phage shock protein C
MSKKLTRPLERKMIGGVCAGLSDYMDIDVSLTRLIFVALGFITAVFPMIIFYLVAWIIIPPEETAPIKKSD